MGRALGDILPLAVAAAIRPGSIIVIVLLLWLVAHGAAVMGILFLLIGFSLIGHGIRELA